MPWLIKNKPERSENLLFVHVPRCGGTSLSQHFDIPQKTVQNRSSFGRLGMGIFFHRYKLLETANFPFHCRENYVCIGLAVLSLAVLLNDDGGGGGGAYGRVLAYLVLATSVLVMALLTFVFTAPVIGRVTWVRRSYLVLIHDVLLQFMESIEWLTGTNNKGYIMHLTVEKLLRYGYVKPDEMGEVCSMAIVRNPYSRMVSIYMYNRFGSKESFTHFVKSWYDLMIHYRTKRECEEYYTPCHCLPQFEFTHVAGEQIVQSVVKQEELKFLKTKEGAEEVIKKDSSVADLPAPVRDALLGMPHTNKRKTDKKWWDYYTQETLDLTYELYHDDFHVFEYDAVLSQRPDLKSPLRKVPLTKSKRQSMLRNSSLLASDEKLKRKASIKRVSMLSHNKQVLSDRTLKVLQEEFEEDCKKVDRHRLSNLSERSETSMSTSTD